MPARQLAALRSTPARSRSRLRYTPFHFRRGHPYRRPMIRFTPEELRTTIDADLDALSPTPANAQSAAAALHAAGASWVTVLSVARLLDEDRANSSHLRTLYHQLPPPTLAP